MKIDQIIRSSRKTIAIIIGLDGRLVIRAPHRATNAQITKFVEEKARWIHEKQAEARKRQAQAAPRQYHQGENFLYLGKPYPLEIVGRVRPSLDLYDSRFLLAKESLPRAQDVFIAWYKKQAHQVLDERASLYGKRYNLCYTNLRITSARTRWGSCSSLGTLSFTWRLVMAPLCVIDYVVIHELAHLVEKNHSKKFWDKVAQMLPEYPQRVRWLKDNGHRLNLE